MQGGEAQAPGGPSFRARLRRYAVRVGGRETRLRAAERILASLRRLPAIWLDLMQGLDARAARAWRVVRRDRAAEVLEENHAYNEERDAASLRICALPHGEEVGVRCVWVMEAYLASQAGELAERLGRLGFTGRIPFTPNPREFLRRARGHGSGRNAMHVGVLVADPKHVHASMSVFSAPLPPGVEDVSLSIHNPLPSITLVAAQFRFTESTARAIEDPFRTMFRSTVERLEGGYLSLLSGADRRREAVSEYRAVLRRRCANWMREHLPGAFAAMEPWEPSPTAELLTLTVGDPMVGWTQSVRTTGERPSLPTPPATPPSRPQDEDPLAEDYLTVLGLSDDWAVWVSVDMPGLSLREPPWPREAMDHLVLATRVQDYDPGAPLDGYGGRHPRGIARRLEHLGHTLTVYALDRLVRAYEARLGTIRDRLGDVPLHKTGRAVRHLQHLERDLALLTRDARPFLADLVTSAPDKPFAWDLYTFVPIGWLTRKPDEEGRSLFARVLDKLVERGKRFLDAEEEVRRTAQSMSGLVVADSTLRLQRAAFWLAVVAALLTALAVPGAVREWILGRLLGG